MNKLKLSYIQNLAYGLSPRTAELGLDFDLLRGFDSPTNQANFI